VFDGHRYGQVGCHGSGAGLSGFTGRSLVACLRRIRFSLFLPRTQLGRHPSGIPSLGTPLATVRALFQERPHATAQALGIRPSGPQEHVIQAGALVRPHLRLKPPPDL
jgi:hypothetical protein